MRVLLSAAMLAVVAGIAHADAHAPSGQGDAGAGAVQFDRQCTSCHIVADGGGSVLAGRANRTGPNLYNVAGRQIGAVRGFRYSDALVAAGATGAVWTEERFAAYVQNPTNWLRGVLGDRRARGIKSYQVRSQREALDIYAYLSTFSD